MKRKTIKKVLNNKIDDWIDSIDNEKVVEAIENSVIITGGAIASMLLDEEVNDFDIYFSNYEDAYTVLRYYEHPVTEIGVEKVEDDRITLTSQGDKIVYPDDIDEEIKEKKYKPIFITPNAITLEGDIQLIFRFIGDADEIHENYDFVHCTNYWTKKDNNLVLRKEALECLLSKELRYIGSKYPICSLIRTRKYIERGFTCNAGEYLKMCWQVADLNLNDTSVLREQLTGVDIHYFNMMIKALMNKEANDEEFKATFPYISKIVDRIFQ